MVYPRPSRRSPLRDRYCGISRSATPQRRNRDDDGISLIEVLVAFVILMITVIPLAYVLNSTLAGATNARQREAALQLADSWIEILSNSTPPTRADGTILTNTPQTPTAPAGAIAPKSTFAGTNYTVKANYSFQSVNQTGQSDLCTDQQPPSPNHPGVIQLQVTVTWDNGNQSLTDTTNINYPKPGLQTQGFLAVQVTNDGETDVHGNSAAVRLQAVPITVTGGGLGSALTLYPDPNGCAFAQVPQGTYTVLVSQPTSGTPGDFADFTGIPPFVDPNGNTSARFTNQVVNVTAETTVSVTFDEGLNTSIHYGGATAVDEGVTCPGTTGLPCVSLGHGPSSAAAAWGDNGSTWSTAALSGATTLSQVGCTTGTTGTCVGVGEKLNGGTSTGVILTTGSNLGGVHADTVPAGVTDVTMVACPSANGCYALGTSSTGPVLLAGAVGQTLPLHDTWTAVSDSALTFTALTALACVPTTTTCLVGESSSLGGGPSTAGIIRLDGDPTTLASNSSWVPTFTLEVAPPNLKSVGAFSCPSSSLCLATGVGDSSSASDPTVLTAPIAAGTDTWQNESTFPTGAGSVTGLSCNVNDCVVIGKATGGGPAVWTGDLTDSPHDWAPVASGANGIPTSVSAVTSVSCGATSGSDLADCVVAANGQAVPGQLIEGSLSGNWAWNATTAPTSSPVLYYTGVSCETSGSGGTICAASGGTSTGPVIVTTSRPNNSSWNVQTPSSLPGTTVTGIPLETSPATLNAWTTQVTQAQAAGANATTLPNVLYPLASGYSIVAGDCSAEVNPYSTGSLLAAPGGTASVTVPLGLLPLQVVNPLTGAPVGGATVTLTSTQCGTNDTYTLPTTDAIGLTSTSVPYGTYTYSVNGTQVANTTLTVAPSAVTVAVAPAPGTATYLPGPVQVIS